MAKFADIVGQEQIRGHLQTALRQKRISHAYLINGERNSGKEFIARIFAMALQCERGGDEPCQECRSCRWYPLCRNGCRRDRTLLADGRTPGLNAYCSAYQDFFSYAYPRLEEMARAVGR